MEIEVGEYVRTNNGVIGKLIRIERNDIDISLKWYVFYDGKNERYINKPYITNHSFNIIDLIEVGDYVNGKLIHSICGNPKNGELMIIYGNGKHFDNEHIKSIVTKEQMKSIEYKVEEGK